MSVALTANLDDPQGIPYFLWDDPMTLANLLDYLRTAPPMERTRMLAKILREARDTDVWRFTTPQEVLRLWPELSPMLGRRRTFWEFLFEQWRRLQLVHG